ncbi:hypothetical protein [Streptomyces sp. NPDC002133]|uniref:hypothetical protein n=1 Tax=Streptomyces sp. NPDC002133 TaxID=3154409 RepID=UPI00332C1133
MAAAVDGVRHAVIAPVQASMAGAADRATTALPVLSSPRPGLATCRGRGAPTTGSAARGHPQGENLEP